jgi:uncharacterized membrane protein
LDKLRGLVRHAIYASRGGFLVRPFAIAFALGLAGLLLSALDTRVHVPGVASVAGLLPGRSDPQVAQAMLSVIATSIMTVVSIVFAILLMTLTLASMQFSPRILLSFIRDQVTQWTLGIFLGTFCYCMAALAAIRFTHHPFAPAMAVAGAMVLALVCVSWLLFFIHHISHAISVNYIVDRIAGDAERVIDQIAPHARSGAGPQSHPEADVGGWDTVVLSETSGYIRFIDAAVLLKHATAYRLRVLIHRRVGHFIAAGTPLFFVANVGGQHQFIANHLRRAFDIGPTRTLEQDVEFGVLQIVDIALRAISPAVNDPSTAISCIDQLSRLLIRWVAREAPQTFLASPPHVLRVVLPWVTTEQLLETAFDQIRHYASSDVAVSLRLLRALDDISWTTEDQTLRLCLSELGGRIVQGAKAELGSKDVERLEARASTLGDRASDRLSAASSASRSTTTITASEVREPLRAN